MESYSNMSSIPHRLDQMQSHVKVRNQQYRSENSPAGYQEEINTPGFYQDNTDHKYHQSNQSIKEFSLGKPNRYLGCLFTGSGQHIRSPIHHSGRRRAVSMCQTKRTQISTNTCRT
jgi:hypothetical protein